MRVDSRPGWAKPEHPDRAAERAERGDLVVGEHQADHEHGVDPLAHRHDVEEPRAALLVAEVVEQQVEARLAQRGLDGVDHLGEEPAVDERDDHADRRGPAAGQPGGERRGDVVELRRGVQHPVAGGARDVRQPAQRPRHGGDRHARPPRDVLDARCHRRLPPVLLRPTWKRYRPSLADSPACAPSTATGGFPAARFVTKPRCSSTARLITWLGRRRRGRQPASDVRVVDLGRRPGHARLRRRARAPDRDRARAVRPRPRGGRLARRGARSRRAGRPRRPRPSGPRRRLGRHPLARAAAADRAPNSTGPVTAGWSTSPGSTRTPRSSRRRCSPACRACRTRRLPGRRSPHPRGPRRGTHRRAGRAEAGPRPPSCSAPRCPRGRARHRVRARDGRAGDLERRRSGSGARARSGREPLPEVIGYWGELFGIETARELGAAGAAGDLFCDGSLGSHTAALHEPYADRADTTGMVRFDDRRRGRARGALHPGRAAGRLPRDRRRRGRPGADAVERRAPRRPAGRRCRTASSTPSTSVTPPGSPRPGWSPRCSRCSTPAWGGAHGMYAGRLGRGRGPPS